MVSTATITSSGAVTGKLHGGGAYTSQIPTALNNSSLSALLLSHKVAVTGTSSGTTSLLGVLLSFLPFLFVIAIFIWIGRASRKQLAGGLSGVMGIGRSKAKVYDEDKPTTRFATSPAMRAPRLRSWKWWTSSSVPNGTRGPARSARRASSWSARRGPVRRCWPEPWPARLTCRSSLSAAQASSRCLSASERPGSGPLRRCQEARARDHLYRRDRRHRGPPWSRRVRLERRTRADAQPAAVGYGRFRTRRQRGRHGGD